MSEKYPVMGFGVMIKAVIFDMYETLVTLCYTEPYFRVAMAADAKVPTETFGEAWDETIYDQSTGKLTLEEALSYTLKKLGRYSDETFKEMVRKRKDFKKDVFSHIHPDIVPMLERLKKSGMKIGLISNCFSEETEYIRQSILYPIFDAPLMSFEQGVCKPDKEIFLRCLKQLEVNAEECLYVGDGGSRELETAGEIGMRPVQAMWYLKEGTIQPSGRKEGFPHAEDPMDVLGYLV